MSHNPCPFAAHRSSSRLRQHVRAALLTGTLVAGLMAPLSAMWAQGRETFVVCSPESLQNPANLQNCAQVRLTSSTGLFEIAIRNLGSRTMPAVPTTIWRLDFATNHPDDDLEDGIDRLVTPVPVGGATLGDASPWSVDESATWISLMNLSGSGVGGCVAGPPAGRFSQAGQTCAAGEYLTFTLSTPRLFNPATFTVANVFAVGLAPEPLFDWCGYEGDSCVQIPLRTVPEPSTWTLLGSGLLALGGLAVRRRRQA